MAPRIVANPTLVNGRVEFLCRCEKEISVGPPHHTIHLGVSGPTTTPDFWCPNCGVTGRVMRGKIQFTGRISLPPSGAIVALPSTTRPAVRVELKTAATAPRTTAAPPARRVSHSPPSRDDSDLVVADRSSASSETSEAEDASPSKKSDPDLHEPPATPFGEEDSLSADDPPEEPPERSSKKKRKAKGG